MSLGRFCLRLFGAHPQVGRRLLRGYLRRRGPVPDRAVWVVENLKRLLSRGQSICLLMLDSGLKMEIDPQTAIGRQIYYHGSCEPGMTARVIALLRPGDVFIDAGANIGEFTLRAAQRVGPSGHVYAIEASPITVTRLRRNVALNRFKNVTVIQAAVCNLERDLEFYLGCETDSGSSSLSQPRDYCGQTAVVSGVTIDGLMEREGRTQVHVIKLDVEGAELDALEGARDLLNGAHPPRLALEYNPCVARRAGWDLDSLTDWLERLNYQVQIVPDESLRGMGSENNDGKCDVIAVPRGARSQRLAAAADKDREALPIQA